MVPSRGRSRPVLVSIPRAALPLAPIALALLAGCGKSQAPRHQPSAPAVHQDTTHTLDSTTLARAESLAAARALAALPRYRRVAIGGPRALASLRDSLGRAFWTWTLKVNRVDSAHVRQGDSLIVPLVLADSGGLALAPFPRSLAAVRDSGRLLFVSRRVQAFAAYDSGRLERWGPVSTGRRDKPTPSGVYHTNWKDAERYSTIDESWLLRWYVNLDNFQGVSFHEYELPGRPASHSCVRLMADDARWVYAWSANWEVAPDRRTIVHRGTPVVIWGDWRYGGRAPWKRLPEDPAATLLTSAEVDSAMRMLRDGTKPDFSIVAGADSVRRVARVPSAGAGGGGDAPGAAGHH